MKKIIQILFLITLALCSLKAGAQQKTSTGKSLSTITTFTCISTSNDSILLKTNLSVKKEDGNTNLANAPIKFLVVNKTGDEELATTKTDMNGNALYKVLASNNYFRNAGGLITFKSVFAGALNYDASEAEFAIKPARLKISFYKVDTVKFIKVEGTQYVHDGVTSILKSQTVNLFVPSLFSSLKIGEISLDSTGSGTLEFPYGLIGDEKGNITLIARIDENEVYGNISCEARINWATPKHLIATEHPSRELWTPIAPLWMIITLIIMLAGVWGHYIYAIYELVMIKREGDKTIVDKIADKIADNIVDKSNE